MLKLQDFSHLPEVDALVGELVREPSGLIVIAGVDARPVATADPTVDFLPSGRSTIFRILMRELLTAAPRVQAVVVAEDKNAVRVPRRLQQQVAVALVRPDDSYAAVIERAAQRRPDLLVVERLTPQNATAALAAAADGLRVLAQVDTIFRGADVLRALNVAPHDGLRWVVAVQRLATLCPTCREPRSPTAEQWRTLQQRYPQLSPREEGAFHAARGCPHCRGSGRQGEITAFDFFRRAPGSDWSVERSRLPLERYMLHLAAEGHLPLDDVVNLEFDQLRRTYALLTVHEQALGSANAALQRKLVELEAANRVLQQRTGALVSLQETGQALLTIVDLHEMAQRICQHTRDLCGADRAVLYLLHSATTAEILAVSGWDVAHARQTADVGQFCEALTGQSTEPRPFNQWPPGIPQRPPDVEGVVLRAGLCVPLVAQEETVGAMVVHTTRRPRFAPGHEALLQTFAQQAALAMQRARLIEQLRGKITALEAAQAELAHKERLERELELARQVQQSVLPRTFPHVAGFTFAARNAPARQVGGDFYDVIRLDEGHFGVAIADVSDKGMPAALYMALTRSLLLAEARREQSPRAVLTNVNQLLLELAQPNMFVTVFYGVVDCATRRLTYARAGHDRPLLLHEGEVRELDGDGMALGLFDAAVVQLAEEAVALAPGDRLVLYTDGLTDVVDERGRSFDGKRLAALLQAHAARPPAELCAATFAHLAAYQGTAEQFDDMTLLVAAVA